MTTCAKCGATGENQTLVYARGGPLVCYREGECALRVQLRDAIRLVESYANAIVNETARYNDLRAAVLAIALHCEAGNDLVMVAKLRYVAGERP